MLQNDVSIEQQIVSSIKKKDSSWFCVFKVQLNTELKNLINQNNEIIQEMNRSNLDLQRYEEKLQILDNMTELATQSLEVYFQTVSFVFL